MNKERISKTTGVHQLPENEWMKMFKVSAQYFDNHVQEMVLRDETILQKRGSEHSKFSDFVRHKFKL